jgi:exopolyphosphatase/pppGpp-phosphohydrolase
MDLGGGSTELVMTEDRRITWHASFPIGSGLIHDRYLPTNPPTFDELHTARMFLTSFLQELELKECPSALIVTGGSANSLLFLAYRAFGLNTSVTRLTDDDLARCEGVLCVLTAEEIATRFQQPLARARVLPAGVVIIRAVMSHCQLHEIRVSSHGIREGVLLAYARYGQDWLTQAERSAREVSEQTVQKSSSPTENVDEATDNETFIETGRRMLNERTKKLLEWRSAVLKHDDIEAVHKMRVASRRLRAALDAYKPVCEPKQFNKVYRHIKKMADILGNARDTDVMIQNLQSRLEHAPAQEQAGVQWLIMRLRSYRDQQQQILKAYFEKLDEDSLKDQIAACLPGRETHRGKS